MKKKLAVLGLAATMMMSLFAGCGGKGTSGGKDASADKGSVYYLNFKPEACPVAGACQDLRRGDRRKGNRCYSCIRSV